MCLPIVIKWRKTEERMKADLARLHEALEDKELDVELELMQKRKQDRLRGS